MGGNGTVASWGLYWEMSMKQWHSSGEVKAALTAGTRQAVGSHGATRRLYGCGMDWCCWRPVMNGAGLVSLGARRTQLVSPLHSGDGELLLFSM